MVTFAYDNRGQLISETRVAGGTTTKYDLDYTYDQVGNRLTKSDAVAGLYTFYHYDVHTDPNEMEDATYHNRLLYYEVYDGDDPNADNLLRTVRYTYYETGWASNISIKDEYVAGVTGGTAGDYDYVQDLALYYYTNGMLWRAIRGAWEVDEYGEVVSNSYTADRAWEFRYDGSPRARYLTVEYDLTGQGVEPDSPGTWVRDGALHWTDYLGDMPWGDLDVDAGGVGDWEDADEVMRYLGLAAQQTADVAADEQYYHEDLIGSTMLTTDDSASDVSTATYTAFGEILDGSGSPGGDPPSGFPRYQYAGGYGYESGILSLAGVNTALAPITLQHLGWRWYQPDTGRFVQRDPIGIFGGMNVYAYAESSPLATVDPSGLDVIYGGGPFHSYPVIQDPDRDGTWWVYHYQPAGGKTTNGPGAVNKSSTSTPPPGTRQSTDRSTDRYLIDLAEAWRTMPPYYCLGWRCCHQFTQEIRRKANELSPPSSSPLNLPKREPGIPCFVAGTQVATPSGHKPIDRIDSGDIVLTWDFATHSAVPRIVVWSGCTGHVRELVAVTVSGTQMRCTPDHPFWTCEHGWILAEDLCTGDTLLSVSGQQEQVGNVQIIDLEDAVPVYDIRVDAHHWFFAGPCLVLVHNT